jgi:hypothetical protein
MGLVVIRDHDRIRDRLGNDIIPMILQGEDNLESLLLVLVPTVAGYSHRQLDLHAPGNLRHLRFGSGRFRWFGPVFQLIGIEDDHTLVFMLLKQLVLFRFPLLLSKGAFPFTLYATITDLHLTPFERLILLLCFSTNGRRA